MRSAAKEWRVEPQRPAPRREPKRSRSLSNGLLARHRLSPSHLLRALRLGGANQTTLPTTLRRYGLVDDHSLASALSSTTGAEWLSPDQGLPDPRLITKIGAGVAMELGCLPWARLGSTTLIASPDPNQFRRHKARLESLFGPVTLALITEADLDRALALACGENLRDAALMSVPPDQSCRAMDADRITRFARWSALVIFPVVALWPLHILLAITCFVIAILFIASGLRLACAAAALAAPPQSREAADPDVPPDELPVISVLVPLYREADIAPRLIARLGALAYPREKIDVLVLVEEDDEVTRNALAKSDLPAWMREVPVPAAALRTKPRALNYGLNFARGSIIGIYDAEDAPEANQLMRVARGFAGSGPHVACLQGVLDYYNPATNWLSRCFTIEYAAWFRLVLPGLERLGLVVPLGGTTLFFRRNVLESLGGWDAWNVTEDADLGLRLARKGYKTRLLSSVTFEEANCEVRP